MSRRPGISSHLVALALLVGGCARPVAVAPAPAPPAETVAAPAADVRPNVVLIFIDDLGWRDVGFMGSRYYETPNIDRLAAAGLIFTAAYANGPNCSPTRASLMTGQYTPRHGIYTVGRSDRGAARHRRLVPIANRETLPLEAETVAEALRRAGYETASIGKWHLGPEETHGPQRQGFDVNVGGNQRGAPRTYFSPYQNPQIADGPEGEYLTDRLTDEAIGFIDANRARPFFLYLTHYAVHVPLQAKADLAAKYRAKAVVDGQRNPVYAAMIESVDQSVGRIMDTLEKRGLARNTVVIFTSDNGGHGPTTSMEPLRGSKGTLYEGGIRVPMAVRWPAVVAPGRRTDTPVITSDFFPTLLELAGAVRAPGQLLDGESLVPLFRGERGLGGRPLFWHFPVYLESYRGQPGHWRTTPAGAIRAGDWKLIEYFEDGRLELYNLADDLSERRNVSAREPARRDELHRQLIAWRRSVGASVPDQREPAYVPGGGR